MLSNNNRKTNLSDIPSPITSDLSALYELLRKNQNATTRRNAAIQLLKLIEKGEDIDREEITDLYKSEKDVEVVTQLKRALNKLKIRETLSEDPNFKI